MYRPLVFLVAFFLYVAGVWAVATTPWTAATAGTLTTAGGAGAPPGTAATAQPTATPASTATPAPSPSGIPSPSGTPAVWTLSTLRNYLVAETDRTDPHTALVDLERITRKDPYVDGFCHPVAHEIGHAALAKYHGDFAKAVSYRDDVCGSGYLHGVVEQKLSESPNPASAVTTLCAPRQTASCIHGIGHGAMFVANLDVTGAERLCDRFPQTSEVVACSEGVFMQLFEPDETDPRAMAKLPADKLAADPLYPCPDQPAVFQSGCYYYAPSYFLQRHDYTAHPEAYVQALAWCLRAPDQGGRASCTKGAGSRLMKYNIERPVWAAAQCEKASPGQRYTCMAGMVSYWDVNYADDSAGSKLCSQLGGEARSNCRSAAADAGDSTSAD
ncbi:hypothetical protein [Streptacidiphilus cavernicola]|uniref:Uncharacterized protein n=1 Tax=Streptacidiphilus cavernicola TaxID=3342716 RepID=A0ABV6VXE8_9ACTN